MSDYKSLSVAELERLSIRVGCETEFNRRADFELRRRGYTFNASEARWDAPAEETGQAQPGHQCHCPCGCDNRRLGPYPVCMVCEVRQSCIALRVGPPAAEGARPDLIEMELRRELWLHHGHRGIYGDDGEMQCAECGTLSRVWDYKRAPLADVMTAARIARTVTANPRDEKAVEWRIGADNCIEARDASGRVVDRKQVRVGEWFTLTLQR